jgi:beta-lactam-binding protein with PASTA domain
VGAILTAGFAGCGGASHPKAASIRVPRLIGMKGVSAANHIYAAGLCLADTEYGAASGKYNVVIAQTPAPGIEAAAKSGVTITVIPAGPSGTVYAFRAPGCSQPLNAPVG